MEHGKFLRSHVAQIMIVAESQPIFCFLSEKIMQQKSCWLVVIGNFTESLKFVFMLTSRR